MRQPFRLPLHGTCRREMFWTIGSPDGLLRNRNVQAHGAEVQLSAACEDRSEAELLRVITFLMGDFSNCRRGGACEASSGK